MDISISKTSLKQQAQLELRQQLLSCVLNEKKTLRTLLDDFYGLSSRNQDHCASLNQKITELLDRIIKAGDWESSLFLRNTISLLKKRLDIANVLKEEFESQGFVAEQAFPPVDPENAIVLYIALYQTDGNTLEKWEKQLSSILKIAQSRPIYDEESKVINTLRSNLDRATDAYVKVLVDKNEIIDSARVMKDRLGQGLITVSITAIRPENIVEFIHQGKRYNFLNKKLIVNQS
jgi:intracellular multiplication protein IcmQ